MTRKVVITSYRPRLRLLAVTLASAGLAIAAWGLYSYTRATTVTDFERAQTERDRLLQERRKLTGELREARGEIDALKDQIVYLERSAEIDQQAYETVRESLATLQEEVASLNEQVAFYRGIVSPDASRAGVRVYDFKVYPTATANLYRFDLVLIQSVRHDRRVAGKVEVTLHGVRGTRTESHRLSDLTLGEGLNLVFSFKYFEEFGGEFRLPNGFRPLRAVVAVVPSGGGVARIEDEFDWAKVQGG